MAFTRRLLSTRNCEIMRSFSESLRPLLRIASDSQTFQVRCKIGVSNFLQLKGINTRSIHSSAIFANSIHVNPRNHQIRAKTVVLIDSNGEKLGTMSIAEALDKAKDNSLQLVQIQKQKSSSPAICKLVSSKTLYESEKKFKHNTQGSKSKELKITGRIAPQDLQWKSKKIYDFLEHGNPVKLSITRKHYQKISITEKMEIIQRIRDEVKDVGVLDGEPKQLGALALKCNFKPVTQKDKAKT